MKMKSFILLLCLGTGVLANAQTAPAPDTTGIHYAASLAANAGGGDFAPYYIASNRHGVVTQPVGTQLRLAAWKPLERDKRFSWSIGVDFLAGITSYTDYQRYDASSATWTTNRQRPAHAWLQQLYGEVKWRSLFLEVGIKEHGSALFNNRLGSGDFVESGNARPIPGVRFGFIDFQDVPFTKGWLQVQGEIAYGKTTDKGWMEDHYNYYNSFLTTDVWYHYKRFYFRVAPQQPLTITVGMQAAAQFNGFRRTYNRGELTGTHEEKFQLRDLWDMFATKGQDTYFKGNHLGAWDLRADYRLRGGDRLSAYFQWPWEDGSGIGKLNGFDGIWGLEWKRKEAGGWLSGAVFEYLTFMNQSGPMHYDPEDNPGTNLPVHTEGADDYYNNYQYNGYAHHGMSIGTPFLPSTLYNLDGYLRYVDSRLRGFHVGVEGNICPNVGYRLLASYRKAFGTSYIPRRSPADDTSVMAEATWRVAQVPGLTLRAQFGIDRGDIYGNNCGALVSVTYQGFFNFKK